MVRRLPRDDPAGGTCCEAGRRRAAAPRAHERSEAWSGGYARLIRNAGIRLIRRVKTALLPLSPGGWAGSGTAEHRMCSRRGTGLPVMSNLEWGDLQCISSCPALARRLRGARAGLASTLAGIGSAPAHRKSYSPPNSTLTPVRSPGGEIRRRRAAGRRQCPRTSAESAGFRRTRPHPAGRTAGFCGRPGAPAIRTPRNRPSRC